MPGSRYLLCFSLVQRKTRQKSEKTGRWSQWARVVGGSVTQSLRTQLTEMGDFLGRLGSLSPVQISSDAVITLHPCLQRSPALQSSCSSCNSRNKSLITLTHQETCICTEKFLAILYIHRSNLILFLSVEPALGIKKHTTQTPGYTQSLSLNDFQERKEKLRQIAINTKSPTAKKTVTIWGGKVSSGFGIFTYADRRQILLIANALVWHNHISTSQFVRLPNTYQ